MKQSKKFILILLCFFAINGFSQNVTNQNDLGAAVKSNTDGANYLCQASIESYHTMKEKRSSLTGVNIDIFNLTTQTEELSLQNHPLNKFSFNFKHGNKYVVMLRKEGYLVKRIVAKVGVEGCIACFEGLNTLTSVDKLEVNSIANMKIMLRKFNEGDRIIIPEIQFEGKSTQLTKKTQQSLNNLATLLKDNSNILGQLELHTDARGDANDNLKLSKERARIITNYLALSGIPTDDISVKGYGERKIVNHCIDGVNCGETQHAKNRRAIFWLRASIGPNQIFDESLANILSNEGSTLASVDEARQPNFGEAAAQEESKVVAPIAQQEVTTIDKKETIVAQKEEAVKVEVQQKEKTDLAKIDKAIPKAEGHLFGASSYNNVDLNTKKTDKMCDVDGKPGSNQVRMEDLGPEIENPMSGVMRSRDAKDKVAISGQMSTSTTVTFDDDGGKDVKRRGRATLVSETFTGYKVELFTSVDELDNAHSVFKRYGKVFLDDTGTSFSYMIGEFEEEESAQKFLKTVIKPFYDEAQVIRYKNGKRK